MKTNKIKINKIEYKPEKFTEKYISTKNGIILIRILIFSILFSIMYVIAVKKVINSVSIMLSCNNELQLSYFKLFVVGFFIIYIYIFILTIILYLLNKLFRIKLTFKEAISIVTSSYIFFGIASLLASILFILNWGYLGYILLVTIFFLTQFNVYHTYYSVVEKHDKISGIIVAIIYVITSIITFIILNITLFSYLKTLYITIC